jgi:hypothetical protein
MVRINWGLRCRIDGSERWKGPDVESEEEDSKGLFFGEK